MEEDKVVDFEELVQYVSQKTGIDQETVEKVLEAEDNFLVEKGIIEEE